MIALYMRLSAADGDLDGVKAQSNSIENQRAILREYVTSDPMLAAREIREFVDDGFTGSNFDRPAVQEMLSLAREGRVEMVVVKDLSRFAREYIDAGTYIEQIFPFMHIRFVALGEGYDSEAADAEAALPDVAIRNIANASYCVDTSVRIRSAMKTRWKRGQRPHATAPFGYVVDPDNYLKLAVDDGAAKVVRRIFELACEGIVPADIARTLNSEGLLDPGTYFRERGWYGYDKRPVPAHPGWNSTKVSGIIANPVHKGTLVLGKTQRIAVSRNSLRSTREDERYITHDAHPAIVDAETFEAAQLVIKHNPKLAGRVHQPKSSFCGLVVRAECGHSLNHCERTVMASYFKCTCACASGDERCVKDVDIASAVALALRERLLKDGPGQGKICKGGSGPQSQKTRDMRARALDAYERMVQGELTLEEFRAVGKGESAPVTVRRDRLLPMSLGKTQAMREREVLDVLGGGREPEKNDLQVVVESIAIGEGGAIDVILKRRLV